MRSQITSQIINIKDRASFRLNEADEQALLALPKLVEACHGKTGQSYKIRALLFSLWNGKPAALINVVDLDWELHKALCLVVMAFGSDKFFYDQIRAAFVEVGLFEWFTEEGEQ